MAHRFLGSLILCICIGMASLSAAQQKRNPVQQHNYNAVWFENWTGLSNAKMVIHTPSDDVIEIVAAQGTPVFQLTAASAGDGIYRYELRAETEERRKTPKSRQRTSLNPIGETTAVYFYRSGLFIVQNGAIITPEVLEEEEG